MPAKGQKIMDEKYLEMLAKAREKANAVRKAKADDKKKIKLAEQLEHHEKLAKADEKIKKAVGKPVEPAPAPVPVVAEKPKKKKPPPVPEPEPETDSGSEDEDESGSEEEVSSPPPPPPPKPKTKAPAKPQAQAQAQAPKQMTAAQHRMLMAFKSLYQ